MPWPKRAEERHDECILGNAEPLAHRADLRGREPVRAGTSPGFTPVRMYEHALGWNPAFAELVAEHLGDRHDQRRLTEHRILGREGELLEAHLAVTPVARHPGLACRCILPTTSGSFCSRLSTAPA